MYVVSLEVLCMTTFLALTLGGTLYFYHALLTNCIYLIEAPEDLLDPVTSELMRDPVILPTSGTTMDRANITRHLLK